MRRADSPARRAILPGLVPRELPKQIGLPAVASLGAAGPGIAVGIAKLPLNLSQTMGVDAWR